MRKGMDAHGAAKLAAMAGPPGTGGATGSEGEGSDGMGDGVGADEEGTIANGGLVPGKSGLMKGVQGSEQEFLDRMAAAPAPKGPRPILPSPAEMREARRAASDTAQHGDIEGDATLPAGWSLIGKPGPYDRRYALSSDEMGAVINGLDPLRQRPDRSGSGHEPDPS
jgi:hypothetical protein